MRFKIPNSKYILGSGDRMLTILGELVSNLSHLVYNINRKDGTIDPKRKHHSKNLVYGLPTEFSFHMTNTLKQQALFLSTFTSRPENFEKTSRVLLIACNNLGFALEKIKITSAYIKWEMELEPFTL